MRKRIEKLTLHRETLRHLNAAEIRGARGGAVLRGVVAEENPSYQSGETYCWCTDTCANCTDVDVR